MGNKSLGTPKINYSLNTHQKLQWQMIKPIFQQHNFNVTISKVSDIMFVFLTTKFNGYYIIKTIYLIVLLFNESVLKTLLGWL